ncbi:DUF167 family protein [Pelagibacterium xiamenense]|uniref:DUF167 family protein n=1 Tax=Pelagibacterium xiamenense TaxID=2901140 RepID=UPI001E3D325E|nr:DUF167 family protein [Pelagibacterium xiamenense]MCD7058345.1 DUF167 family protein [Pelagibacterium xiamenense]
MPDWYKLTETGVLVFVRVTPNASQDAIEGIELRADGTEVLKLRTRVIPDKGRANAAVVAILAKALRVPKSALAITAGATARVKTIGVTGDRIVLAAALDAITPKTGAN